MKKILYLMRHGETLFNVRKKIQGACDSPLTKKGIHQAEVVANFFDSIPIDYVYCSTAERSVDTLEIVTRNKMPYTRVKGLKERNFGMFEGEREDIHLYKHFETIYGEYGGETTEEVRKRMVETLTTIMEREGHDTVLAVSHGGACSHFLSSWTDLDEIEKAGGVPNCCILKFEYENQQFVLLDVIRHDFSINTIDSKV